MSYESLRLDQLSFSRFFHYGHFKFGKSTNYCFGAIRVEIQFLYNKHGQVGRHMKDLDQIIHISKAFFILDTLSWSNQADNFIGLSGS